MYATTRYHVMSPAYYRRRMRDATVTALVIGLAVGSILTLAGAKLDDLRTMGNADARCLAAMSH